MSRRATGTLRLRRRRDVHPGSQFLLADELAAKRTHVGTFVETKGAPEAVAADKQPDRAATAPVEFPELVPEQREAETAAAPRRANVEAGDNAAGAIERQVPPPEHVAGNAVAVPRPPTATRPG